MSLSSFSSASAFFTDFSVTLKAVPSGRRSCRNSSGRSDSGKNCCCTWPKPTIESDEHADGRQHHLDAVIDAPLHHAAQAAIDAGLIDRVRIVVVVDA